MTELTGKKVQFTEHDEKHTGVVVGFICGGIYAIPDDGMKGYFPHGPFPVEDVVILEE